MHPAVSVLLLASIVLNVAIGGARWLGRKRRRAYWLFRGVPVSSIRDAPEGTVHFRGRVLCDGPLLEAPLSGRRCVLHDVLVEELPDVGWTPGRVLRRVRGLRFRIDDGSGTALVVFQGAGPDQRAEIGPRFVECEIPRDARESGGFFAQRKTPRTDALARELGLPGDRVLGPELSGSEGVIEVGDIVDVLGRGARRVVPGGQSFGYRAAPEEYVVEAAEDAPLLLVKRAAKRV